MKNEFYWKKGLDLSEECITNKSLIPLKTELIYPKDNGHNDFELRRLIGDFPKEINTKNKQKNPFLPCDQRLIVSEIEETHLLILNKYPVQRGHMLLITREWQPQDGWLTCDDFNNLLLVEDDTNGLWFFNSSKAAGASQPHRHIQLLPRNVNQVSCPRTKWFNNLIANNLDRTKLTKNISIIQRTQDHLRTDAKVLYKYYLELCLEQGLGNPKSDFKPKGNYNLIITNDWISLIRRNMDSFMGFNINALGFAGYLLSTSQAETDYFKLNGGESILKGVVP